MDSDKTVLVLKGDNYHRWKFELEASLDAKDCLDIVNGTEKKTVLNLTGSNKDAVRDWERRDAKARHLISKSLDDEHHTYVRGCTSSMAMMEAIKSVMEQQSETHVIMATEEWHAYQWTAGQNVTTFLAGLNVLTQRLKSLGTEMAETTVIGKVLRLLPLAFSSFRTSWRFMSSKDATLATLTTQLLAFELDMKLADGDTTSGGEAFYGNKFRNNGRNGHSDKKSNEKRIKGFKIKECWHCGKKGHLKKDCFKLKKEQGDETKNKSNGGFTCNFKSLSSQTHRDVWCADSGAYSHITRNKHWFSTMTPITPETIVVGDGREVVASMKGDINVEVFDGTKWYQTTLYDVKYVPDFGNTNLFSIGVVDEKGYDILFSNKKVLIKKNNQTKLQGIKVDGVYLLSIRIKPAKSSYVSVMSSQASGLSTPVKDPCKRPLELKDSSHNSKAELAGNESIDGKKAYKWHLRLGHISQDKIKKMVKNKLVKGLNYESLGSFFCEGCQFGRMVKKSFGTPTSKETIPGVSIHSDVCGPYPVKSVGGSRYFMVFKCEATAFRAVYFMKEKTQALKCLKQFIIDVSSKTNWKIKRLRTDNGKEYVNSLFKEYLIQKGIKHEFSPPYTPQMNGMAEREIRTLCEMSKSMLKSKDLPNTLWSEAVFTAAHIMNRVPNRKESSVTPYESWFGKKPSISHFRIFGSTAYVHIPGQLRKKLDSNARRVIFVGYGSSDKLFRVYDPLKRDVETVREITFHETLPSKYVLVNDHWEPEGQELVDGSYSEQEEEEDDSFISCSDGSDNQVPYHERDVSIDPEGDLITGHDMDSEPGLEGSANELTYNSNAPSNNSRAGLPSQTTSNGLRSTSPVQSARRKPGRPKGSKNKPKEPCSPSTMSLRKRTAMVAAQDPSSLQDALSREDRDKWQEAMEEEIDALDKNKTWKLVNLPSDRMAISSRWVFRIKYKPDGSLERYKARLVAKGFSQRPGVDYSETFAPVVRFESVRVILALAATMDMEMCQFDVKTAFLHGELKEDLYMNQPEGFDDGSSRVCHLLKGLYGLKQAPRAWNSKFHSFLSSYGLTRSEADHCVYSSDSPEGKIILGIYVDDGLLCCTSKRTMDKMMKDMHAMFEIKVGDPDCFVGLHLSRDRNKRTIRVSQHGYISRMLDKYNMSNCKSAVTPGESKVILTKEMSPNTQEEKDKMSGIPYREVIGSLNFAMICSRPDIAFEVSRVAQFSENPGELHWKRVKRILRYLKGTMNYSLVLGSKDSSLKLTGFCDADWGGDHDNRRSTTGFLFTLAGSAVSWSSKLQRTVAQSSCEAEYMAAGEATKEAKWLTQLLSDLGHSMTSPTIIFSDNQGAIDLSRNPGHHHRTKHIDIRHHFIREVQEAGVIALKFIPTNEQPADMLTKSLVGPKHDACCHAVNLIDDDTDMVKKGC